MDGVLADFARAFRDVETALFGPTTTHPVEQPEEEEERQEKGIVQSRARRDAVWKEIQNRPDFWFSLEQVEPGAVARLYQLSLAHRWEVFFITQRPATAGETVQRQTQRWLAAQGFDFPSVLVLAGARGAAIRVLRIDYHVDDSAQNCLDVIADSTAKTLLVAADPQADGCDQRAKARNRARPGPPSGARHPRAGDARRLEPHIAAAFVVDGGLANVARTTDHGLRLSIEARDALAQRLDVFPDLRVLLDRVVALLAVGGLGVFLRQGSWREPEISLQVAQRGGEVLEVIGEQTAIAQLGQRRRVDCRAADPR